MASAQGAILGKLGGQPFDRLLPARLLRRRPERPRFAVMAIAAALFVCIFAARLATADTTDPLFVFATVPIAVLALEAGTKGGIAGATIAVAGLGIWSLINNVELPILGYLARVSTFFLVGTVVGLLADYVSRARSAQRSLLELYPESAIALDLNGQVTIANTPAEVLFGYGPDELVGLPIDHLLPDFFGALEGSVRDPTKRTSLFRLTASSKNGAEGWVRVAVDGLASDAGVLLVRLRQPHVWPEIVGPWRGSRL
jgi:PAS domain S-box-containing protein